MIHALHQLLVLPDQQLHPVVLPVFQEGIQVEIVLDDGHVDEETLFVLGLGFQEGAVQLAKDATLFLSFTEITV